MNELDNDSFDCVIDKALLDSILCGPGYESTSSKMISNVHRVLKRGGVYICISIGNPESRLNILKCINWDIKMKSISVRDSTAYIYYLTKKIIQN